MLKSLKLINFQRHKKLEVKFDRFVTTITGPNDAGKSAVVRAISAVCGRPTSARRYITKDKSSSRIRLKIEKHTITRRIGSNNAFILDGKVYRASRGNAPEDIEKILRIAEINTQRQHEPVFWFSLTPGQVARELNKLVDLDSIDAVQADIAKQLRDKRAELEVAKNRLAEAEGEVDRLKWLPSLDVKLGKLETRHSVIASKSHILARIRGLIRAAMVHTTRHDIAANGAAAAAAAVVNGAAASRLDGRLDRLRQIVARMLAARHLVRLSIPKLPELPEVNEEVVQKLEELIADHQEKEKELCQCQKRQRKLQEKLRKQLKGKCPVCGSSLK